MTARKFLKPMNHKIKDIDIFGFDIETYGNTNKFLMGSIVNDKNKFVFWDKKEMQDFIFNSPILNKAYMFATNLGFDFLGTFGDNFETLAKFNYLIRKSDFINIKYINPNKHGTIEFLDTLNFLKVSVKALGKIIGEEKLPPPYNLGKKVLQESEEGKYLEKYNIQDSLITYKFADFLNKSFNSIKANMGYTIASTSMSLFRNKYLKTWLLQPKYEDLIKMYMAYYGGRTDIFIRGNIDNLNLNLYDINSLYPYCMQEYKYPFPNYMAYIYSPNISILNYEGISKCIIKTPKDLHIPLLPHRYDNKLTFPLGKFEGWHSHVELRKAIELNYKIEIIETYYYTKTFNPFNNFVNDLYNKRMEYKRKNNKMEIIFKILLNSLYGKFAQQMFASNIMFTITDEQKNKFNEIIKINSECALKNKPLRYGIDTPDTNIKLINGFNIENPRLYYITDFDTNYYSNFINPILSIYTTSYARLKLYSLFEEVEKNNKDVYYCDTDSIITDYKFKEGVKLGELKKEIKIDNGLLVKPKMYYLEELNNKIYTKSKGLRNLRTIEDFNKLIETKTYKYTKFTKFKESLRRNLSFNQILEVEKFINLDDNKRIWKHDHFNKDRLERSKPLKLNQII